MTESQSLPMNFGGIAEEEFSSFENSRVLVWPISYEGTVSYGGGTGQGAMAVIDASRNMELYDEETRQQRQVRDDDWRRTLGERARHSRAFREVFRHFDLTNRRACRFAGYVR